MSIVLPRSEDFSLSTVSFIRDEDSVCFCSPVKLSDFYKRNSDIFNPVCMRRENPDCIGRVSSGA